MPRNELTKFALQEVLPSWGVLVLESHHAPDFTMEWRKHAFIKCIYVLGGSGRIEVGSDGSSSSGGEHFDFQTRDILIVPPSTANRVVDSPESMPSLYIFCLSPHLLEFDPSIVESIPMGRMRRSPHFANHVEQRLRRLLYAQSLAEPMRPLQMVAEGVSLLEAVLAHPLETRNEKSLPQAVDRLEVEAYVRYLRKHFYEATTIDAAANRLGIERRRFTQLFREATGCSWLEYVRGLAIEHAVQLLITTDLPIVSVAFECGFEDLSTFYRRFKNALGLSPGQFREQKRARA